MKTSFTPLFYWVLFLGIFSGISQPITPDTATFKKELKSLEHFFNIPGLAAVVSQNDSLIFENYSGFADYETSTRVNAGTLFPVASITKVFSGVLAHQLVKEGVLDFETKANTYGPFENLGDSILVKHILSHTSEGKLGSRFHYSARFGLLTPILEKSSGRTFADLMQQRILDPLAMDQSFLLNDEDQVKQMGIRLATPYFLDPQPEKCFIEYGYSASAGLVSTARELLRFSQALPTDTLLSPKAKTAMFTPFYTGSPYGMGIFTTSWEGHGLLWAYGQYDCYSSLMLQIPELDLHLVLLANNNLMSDPARLIYGDISSSLFALSFLKNFVSPADQTPLFYKLNGKGQERNRTVLDKQLLIAQALAEGFMARFDPSKIKKAELVLKRLFAEYPDYLTYANAQLLHTLAALKDTSFHYDQGPFTTFDTEFEAIGKYLIQKEPDNPYLHLYMGGYYTHLGQIERARPHYLALVNAKNQREHWYTREAAEWLAEHP
ncbi:serine hydrolase domain-containing protein [Sediminicola luteus]|nr:serine hydrolase domain-containing protein [Sediminicola luteus]